MAGLSNTVESDLLDYLIATYSPTTKHIGLSSTTPTEAGGNFTEPTGGAYARVSTTSADWAAAVAGDPSTKATSAAKTFPTATADWLTGANLTHFGLWSASTGGSLLIWGALATPRPVLSGDVASFAAGSLRIALGDPTDLF